MKNNENYQNDKNGQFIIFGTNFTVHSNCLNIENKFETAPEKRSTRSEIP